MKRYEVCTYSNDIGTGERMDFDRLSDAIKDAKTYRKTEEYAAVYDRIAKIAYVVFGNPLTPVFCDWVTVLEY